MCVYVSVYVHVCVKKISHDKRHVCVCPCLCVSTCVYVCMCERDQTVTRDMCLHVCLCVCICVCVCTCVYVCVHVCIWEKIRQSRQETVCIYVCVCLRVYVCVSILLKEHDLWRQCTHWYIWTHTPILPVFWYAIICQPWCSATKTPWLDGVLWPFTFRTTIHINLLDFYNAPTAVVYH